MTTAACFIIVSRNDIPINEAKVGFAAKREDVAQLPQFILQAALDIVQDLAWTNSAMILKTIDKFNDLVVSVYVTADRFMLLYGSRSDDGIKSFFQEVHELYIKSLLNPLYLPVPALHHHISIQKLVLLQENISRQAIFSVQELDIELNINS